MNQIKNLYIYKVVVKVVNFCYNTSTLSYFSHATNVKCDFNLCLGFVVSDTISCVLHEAASFVQVLSLISES